MMTLVCLVMAVIESGIRQIGQRQVDGVVWALVSVVCGIEAQVRRVIERVRHQQASGNDRRA